MLTSLLELNLPSPAAIRPVNNNRISNNTQQITVPLPRLSQMFPKDILDEFYSKLNQYVRVKMTALRPTPDRHLFTAYSTRFCQILTLLTYCNLTNDFRELI